MLKYLLLLLISSAGQAEELRYMNLERMGLELAFVDTFKDSYFPQTEHQAYDKAVAAVFDLELVNGVYWDNKVLTLGNESQVRTVSWEWDLAFRVNQTIEVFHYHHSQHVLDEAPPLDQYGREEHFPLRDFYGVRIIFYEHNGRAGWW